MTLTDSTYQEKKKEEHLPALKLALMQQYNYSKII